ncbi:TRAP transporter small permease [Frigidibacter sp. ROC022]|uniref:TRAP transporter small permease n=1 Tax=Frigidibacter sp. ROC022 TaxID=2971796 RepID=UPI00215A1BB4|nr:TRAP transporter small permease [Frigidibacter sp. ROC022]MCR8726061.1 TRAP transporter small permease [Frigidibacter sp. ROC022]
MDYRPQYPAPLRALSFLIDICLALGGISIVALVFINALLRGAAGFDLAWSLEVTAFLLLWTTFLGAAAAMARGAHMRVTEIVANLVPRAAQAWLALLIDLIVTAMLASLIWYGVSIASHSWAQKTTVLYWPVGLLYASMPTGMAFALVFHLFNLVRDWRHPETWVAKDADDGAAQ